MPGVNVNQDIQMKVLPIFDMKIEHITEEGVTKTYLSGYANTKDHADSYGDIPHSLDGAPVYNLKRMDVKVGNPACFVDHRSSASNIAGNFVELKEDDIGLFFKLLLRPLDMIFNPLVKDAVSAFMEGFGRALSIGGQWFFEDKDNENHLTRADLYEISLVGIGADELALTTSVRPKSADDKGATQFADLPLADRDRPWDSDAALGRVREWAGIDGDGSLIDPDIQRKYRKAFFWVDEADADLFGAYKLPFADIIDGNLTAIPRGIFAAAASLRGARGGVFLPTQDRPEVIRHVERYYEKMGMESPFGRSFRVDDLSCLTDRLLEGFLKEGISFSGQDAKAVISALKQAGLRDGESEGTRDEEFDAVGISEGLDKLLTTLGGRENA